MGGGHVEIQTSYKILKLILYWLIKKQQIYGRIWYFITLTHPFIAQKIF